MALSLAGQAADRRRTCRSPESESRPGWARRRARAVWLAAAGLLLAAPLPAAEGLYLTWNACAQDAGVATANLAGACASEIGSQALYGAFTLPQAMDSVIAVEIVVDLQAMDATLPAWWHFEPGGCRDGVLQVDASFPQPTQCADPWAGVAPDPAGGLLGYFVGEPRGGAAQARMKISLGVLPGNSRRLEADVMYYAAHILLPNQGTAACNGCSVPVCLVLNSILVKQLPGAPGGDLLLETPGAGDANRATWQGTGANCGAVPVRRRTWGQLKSLYR